MKKKFIASLLLTAFINNTVYAEKIIFNTQGVPVKNSQNSPVYTTIKEPKVDTSSKLLTDYETKNKKIISKHLPNQIDTVAIAPLTASQNGGTSSSWDAIDPDVKGRVELPWYNGNYIVWNTGMAKDTWYTGEFNLNRNKQGFVIIIKNGNTFICADYISGYLTTVFIYHKDSHKAGFLYDSKGSLLMSKIDNNVNVVKSNKIKNKDFINKIIPIFDNPQAAVKANVKYSEKKEINQTITNKPVININSVNYKASSFNMDLGQAISYYWTNIDNNPEALKLYNLLPNLEHRYSSILTIKHPTSYFKAIEEGLIPTYLKPNYKLGKNQVMMDSTLDIYHLMRQNNFAEQKIKNFIYFYTASCFDDTEAVSISEIKNIMDNSLLTEDDKFYRIIAKIYALHYNNPKIEEDIINSYKLLKNNPQIIPQGLDLTELHDEIFRIINYYPEACKTEESIKTALNTKSLSNEEKFYKVLGLLKKETLLENDDSYPQQLYDIAETGIMTLGLFNNNDSKEFYEKEEVLNDVLSASKLLMKSKFWEWANLELENNDMLSIAPELCLTTKIVTEVLKDKSIAEKDREEIISNRLYKEKAIANNKDAYSFYQISSIGYKSIDKGYVTRGYINFNRLKYSDESEATNNFVDLMRKNNLNSSQIKDLIQLKDTSLRNKVVTRTNEINTLPQNKKVYKIKRMFIEETDYKSSKSKTNILKLYDNGLLENIYDFKDILSVNYSDIYANIDIDAYISLKNIEGFSDQDIHKFISRIGEGFKLDKDIIKTVLNDKNIKPKDRPAFIYALARQNSSKCDINDKTPEAYFKAIDEGIIPLYYSDNDKDNKHYENLIEMYKYMKYNLGYDGNQIDKIMTDMNQYPYFHSSKILPIVKDDKLNYEQKLAKLEQMKKSQENTEERLEFMKDLPMNILKIITFPLWIGPVLILNWIASNIDWR